MHNYEVVTCKHVYSKKLQPGGKFWHILSEVA